MNYGLILLLAFFSFGCKMTRYEKTKIEGKDLVQKLEECLEANVEDAALRTCPNYDKKSLFEYYRQEIYKFSLNKALVELSHWNDRLSLNRNRDTIALIFFYPAVGFDPEQGYITEYYIYGRSLRKGVIGESDTKASPFKISRLSQSTIKAKLESYKSYGNGCETGLLTISYLSPDLEFLRCHVTLGLNIMN